MSPELTTLISAMLPLTELRGAIPLGKVLGLSPMEAFIWATIGNIIPNFFILAFLDPASKFLMKHSPFFDKFFTKLFHKTRTKHTKKFDEYGALFLVTFIAIPLPGTGGWSGSLIAFLFGVPYWKAVGLVSLGITIAGVIVTLGLEGIVKIVEYFV